jgi:hypothetical protein
MSDTQLLQHYLDQRDRWAMEEWGLRKASIHLPVLGVRARVFAAHVASMVVHPEIQAFAATMTERFGPYLRVHHFVADWITALLILRYGEESRAYDPMEVAIAETESRAPQCSTDPNFDGWPTTFSIEDHQRAAQLLKNHKWPEFFVLLTPPPATHEAPE